MSSCITLHLSPRCILMSPFQPLPRSKTHMKPCPGGSPSQAASAGAGTRAWRCYCTWRLPRGRNQPGCRQRPAGVQSSFPLHISFARDGRGEERLLPAWSFAEPWKHHSCLGGAAELHRNPGNQITSVASVLFPHQRTKGHQARIT